MIKLFQYLIGILTILAAAAFLVANRQLVAINFDPFSAPEVSTLTTPAMPLWAVLIGAMLAGYAIGAFGMWLTAGSVRRKARSRKQEVAELKREVAAMNTGASAPKARSDLKAIGHQGAKR